MDWCYSGHGLEVDKVSCMVPVEPIGLSADYFDSCYYYTADYFDSCYYYTADYFDSC